ncbi:MAG: ATP-grasp domain-containing protein [Aureliella sp.]
MASSTEPASASIRTEGWAMCRAALASLAAGGHQALAVIDSHCAIDPHLSRYRNRARNTELELVELSAGEDVQSQWRRVYSSCDYTLVIAPECDRILVHLLAWCRRNGIRTCNCSDTFVEHAGNKLLTAKFFQARGVAHPPTLSLADAQRQWASGGSGQRLDCRFNEELAWTIKPVDGAGCDGMVRISTGELRRHGGFLRHPAIAARGALSETERSRWIVQPWLPGLACSRSAIIDRDGGLHWLPVTRQHLSIGDRVAYLGGRVEPELAARIPGLDALLTRAINALGGQPLGWVGVDFLYDENNPEQPITVIEINPRLTTSFVGLATAGAPDLAAKIVAAVHGEPVELPSQWQKIDFSTAPSASSSASLR